MENMWAGPWDKVKAQVTKNLGDGAKVPDVTGAITKAYEQFSKGIEDFDAARGTLEEAILAMDNANSGLQNAVEQFRAKVEKYNFELDPKKDAKKIADAHKTVDGFIADRLKAYKTNDKMLDELTKHLSQLGNYKAPG